MTFALIILVLLVGYLILCDVVYRIVCDRKADFSHLPKPSAESGFEPWDEYRSVIDEGKAWYETLPNKRVTIQSHDGLTLVGHYIPAPGADQTILLAHGYRSQDGTRDFSCAFQTYSEKGYNLLLIDQRAHGESQGRYIGFGVPERHDIVQWTQFLNQHYPPRAIVIEGMSMGSATVLMALDLDLPENVVGAIADCGYTTPRKIIAHVFRRLIGIPLAPFWPGIQLCAKLRSGYFLSGASAIESLKKARIPLLFIHGEDDNYVPCDMGRENYSACASRKQLLTVPGAGHGVSFIVDNAACNKALFDFLDSVW